MSIEKSEIKRAIAQDIARQLESQQDEAKRDVIGYTAGIEALQRAIQLIQKKKSHWQSLIDKGDCSEIEYNAACSVIESNIETIQSMIVSLQSSKTIKSGEIRAYEFSLDVCEKIFNEEGRKAAALLKMMKKSIENEENEENEKNDSHRRPVGSHPGESLASDRKKAKLNARQAL